MIESAKPEAACQNQAYPPELVPYKSRSGFLPRENGLAQFSVRPHLRDSDSYHANVEESHFSWFQAIGGQPTQGLCPTPTKLFFFSMHASGVTVLDLPEAKHMPRNGETNQISGIYRAFCCDAEIMISVGALFPDCPNHKNLFTEWKLIIEIDSVTHKPKAVGKIIPFKRTQAAS
jgi:hypothetical protein